MNTHPEQWAAIYAAAPGEQLGVRCLAQRHVCRGIEGGESAGHSLPSPTIPTGLRFEPVSFGLQVRLSNLTLTFEYVKLSMRLNYVFSQHKNIHLIYLLINSN